MKLFDSLIAYDTIHEACAEMFGFGGVKFLRPFGPWCKGDTVSAIWFNLESGMVTEFAEDGVTAVRTIKFELAARS